jgi:hypothetical protein
MSLSLWRHEEVGIVPLPREKQDVRYGRRQNALLLTPPQVNMITNGKLLNAAPEWTLTGAGSKESTADLLPPFGYQSLRLTRTDTGTGQIFLARTFTPATSINGSRKASFTVWVSAPIGTVIDFQITTPAAGASLAQTINLSQTVEVEGWHRKGFVFTLASTEATTLTTKMGTSGPYTGPIYLNGASFNWDITRLFPYVDPDYGAKVNGGGLYEAEGTDVQFDIPSNILRPDGAISFWYNRTDGSLTGSIDLIAAFLNQSGGLQLQIHIANSFTTTDQVIVTGNGIGDTVKWDVQGLTGVDEWNHYMFTWNHYGQWAFYIDGARQPKSADTAGNVFTFKNISNKLYIGRNIADTLWGNGLLEGFTVYDRPFRSDEVASIYKAGDNIQTGAIAHLGLWSGQPLLELGEAIGFMDTGDYRVQPGGYVPGSATAMPTVRYEANRNNVGPYIVSQRVPNVVESITFAIDRQQQGDVSASAKFAKLKEVIVRSATQEKLCLNYSPLRSKRNVRAYVNYAAATPGPGWTGVEQVADRMVGATVDLERESQFSDPAHRLGSIVVAWNTPVKIPDVTGSAPAPMGISIGQTPGNFYLGLRRLNLPKIPVYLLGSAAGADQSFLATTVTDAAREGGNYKRWTQAQLAVWSDGRILDWTATQIADRANFGNYRALVVARLSAAVDVSLWLKIGDSLVSGRVGTTWQALDFGNINIPGKNVRQPGLHESTNQIVRLGVYNKAGAATFNLDVDAVFLIPVDDGFAQVLRGKNTLEFPTLLDGDTGDVTADLLLNAYAGGLSLSPTVATELRALQLTYADLSGVATYDYNGTSTTVYIEYVPKWSGLGDVP